MQSESAARAAISSAAQRRDFACIARCMQAHRASVAVAADGCRAVRELLRLSPEPRQEVLPFPVGHRFRAATPPVVQAAVDGGALEAVCAALADHGATDASGHVSWFGGSFLCRCTAGLPHMAQRAGAAGAVIRGYTRPPLQQLLPEMPTPAVLALANCILLAPETATAAYETGVVPVIMATLRNAKRGGETAADAATRDKWAALRRAAFTVFCNLIAVAPAAAELAGRMGAVEMVLQELRENAADAKFVDAGICTLHKILLAHLAGGAVALAGGAVALLRAAQQAHPAARSCRTLPRRRWCCSQRGSANPSSRRTSRGATTQASSACCARACATLRSLAAVCQRWSVCWTLWMTAHGSSSARRLRRRWRRACWRQSRRLRTRTRTTLALSRSP